MSIFFIALLVSGGIGGWIYQKFARRTGSSNTGPALIASAACTIVIFLILYTLMNAVVPE